MVVSASLSRRRVSSSSMIGYVLCILLLIGIVVPVQSEFKPFIKEESQAELFEPSDAVTVNSASHFPKPTRKLGSNATIIVEPTFGEHRPEADAILAYAEGYQLSYYMMFLETLAATGFTGDVVLAIAEERIVRNDVVDYLKTYATGDRSKPNVVVYQQSLDCDNEEEGNHKRRLTKKGDTDGESMTFGHEIS